jgi:hypothetical protein
MFSMPYAASRTASHKAQAIPQLPAPLSIKGLFKVSPAICYSLWTLAAGQKHARIGSFYPTHLRALSPLFSLPLLNFLTRLFPPHPPLPQYLLFSSNLFHLHHLANSSIPGTPIAFSFRARHLSLCVPQTVSGEKNRQPKEINY